MRVKSVAAQLGMIGFATDEETNMKAGLKLPNSEKDQAVWDMFFAEVAGWSIHPGFNRENAKQPTISECADMADEMLRVRNERRGS